MSGSRALGKLGGLGGRMRPMTLWVAYEKREHDCIWGRDNGIRLSFPRGVIACAACFGV